MDKPKTELANLDQPLEMLSPEQASGVGGGHFNGAGGVSSLDLPAVQGNMIGTDKVQVHDISVTQIVNKATP